MFDERKRPRVKRILRKMSYQAKRNRRRNVVSLVVLVKGLCLNKKIPSSATRVASPPINEKNVTVD